jgi:lysophospholipase L1-like esterase
MHTFPAGRNWSGRPLREAGVSPTFSWGISLTLTIGLLCAAGGCQLSSLLDGSTGSSQVYIISVEQLSPPAVTEPDLYKPDFTFPIDLDDPAAGQAAGFFLNLTTADPSQLQMRLLSGSDATPIVLQRISPLPNDTIASPAGGNLPDQAREPLRAGQGVFWLTDESVRGPNHRAAVALPDTWTQPSVMLQIYTATTAAGAPLLPAQIELAHDFFYMAAIGDSVVWGNGLLEPQKFTRLIAAEIQRRTRRRVVLQVQALSGARIVPDPADVICRIHCNGEIEQAGTSITTQVDLLEAPELLELVLMDGCINDVGVSAILNANTLPEALTDQTHTSCHDEMLKLVQKVRSAIPVAAIIVTGYYPIVSMDSNARNLAQFFTANSVSSDPAGLGVIQQIVERSSLFFDTSTQSLATAVEDANAAAGGSAGIAFANPGFGPENAVFASQPLLWGLTADRIQQQAADQGFTLFPEDPLATLRATQCFASTVPDPLTCLYASVGHPNPAGAQRYADAIIPLLEQLGIVPQ